ncbi:MAG: SIMPL domain-containing protein [Candidatus Kuenenbacteria bacterium]
MKELIQKNLGTIGIIILFIFALSYGARSFTQILGDIQTLKQYYPSRNISITSEEKIAVMPDIAQFNFSVITKGGKNLSELQTKNIEKINAIIAFLKEERIDDKNIKTQNYNITPRYLDYSCLDKANCPPIETINPTEQTSEIIGYTVEQTFLIKVKDLKRVDKLISGVVNKGANIVSSLNFALDDPTVFQNKAREKAIAKAKEKALMISTVAGLKLGKIISINDYIPDQYTDVGGSNQNFKSETLMPLTIKPGWQDIKAGVNITYEIIN